MIPRGALVALACLLVGCAETTDLHRTQLDDARRTLDRKEVELRAYQWQLSTLAQQLREAQARSDETARELRQLVASNATLGERVKQMESDRAASLAIPAIPDNAKAPRETVDVLRRLTTLLEAQIAQNARLAEELAGVNQARQVKTGGTDVATARPMVDVVDPWGFRTRK